MKKKLFGFIIAFVVFLTGVMFLTACDGGDPTLSKIVLVVNNTEHETYDFGDIEYGTTPNLAYKVYAKYSDETKKELTSSDYSTEYQFNSGVIESLPTTYDIGSYTIKISYKGSEVWLFFNIIAATRSYQTALIPQKTQWTYGDAQPDIKISDDSIQLESGNYKYVEKSKIADSKHITKTELDNAGVYNKNVALDPGEYYLFVVVPAIGNYAETASTLVAVTVKKANLVVSTPTTDLKATYTYNSSHFGNITANDIEKPNIVIKTTGGEEVDFVQMNFAEPNKVLNSTDNGTTIKLNFTLEEEYQKYYIAPEAVDILLEINKATADKPSIRNNEDQIEIYFGDKASVTVSDAWEKVTLTVTKPDDSTSPINIESAEILLDKPTVVGKYTYTISLKDKVNFTWKDGTTEDQLLEWEIKELNMESLKWRFGNVDVTNGQSFIYDSENLVSPPEVILPTTGINRDVNGYKYYKADGTELQEYPTTIGSYYATFSKDDVFSVGGCYIITGELARIEYSIIAGEDVEGKSSKFVEIKLLKEDGTELTPAELEGASELVAMTEAMNLSNKDATAKCEENGTVSGTCDFGSGSFSQLIEDGTPYKYTYSPNRVNTVEIFAEEQGVVIEESKLVGNFINDTLTLTMSIDNGLIWQFTFELIIPTEA